MREFERLHDEVDRLFRTSAPSRNLNQETCVVPVDIHENVEEVVLHIELPGVPAAEVQVRVEDNVLTVEGEKKFTGDRERDSYLRIERYYGKFSRSFTMPHYVDSGKILAEARDGILTLRLPKKAETKPRQIQVKVG